MRNDFVTDVARYELDGSFFRFKFRQNPFSSKIVIDIADDVETMLVAGRNLALSNNFYQPFENLPGMPAGTFIVLDTTDTDTEPDFDNFGDSVVLLYEEANA